ncbi:MAG: hypothetical protein AAGA15_10115 [Pseudomonadota bacterium]
MGKRTDAAVGSILDVMEDRDDTMPIKAAALQAASLILLGFLR